MNNPPRRHLASHLSEADMHAWYGRWAPLSVAELRDLFDGSGVRWWIIGGLAIDVATGTTRRHDDVDVSLPLADLDALRAVTEPWHLWEAHSGTLTPLLPGNPMTEGRQQLWLRRDADGPWLLDLPMTPATDQEWVFKNDHAIRLPLSRALHRVDGVDYLAPQCVLLHKAHLLRDKDRRDFTVTLPHLTAEARSWLADCLDRHLPGHEWLPELR